MSRNAHMRSCFVPPLMAPLTRSSAPSTPATPRAVAGTDTQVTPTRRAPHCTKCHRPRAGHPRSGCPFADASSDPNLSSSSIHKPTSRSARVLLESADDGLSEELSSLQIVNPTEDKENLNVSVASLAGQKKPRRKLSVRFALVPEQTLASLSPTDSQLVEQLLQPGMAGDAVLPQDKLAHVLRWQRTLDEAGPLEDGPAEEPVQTKEQPIFSDPPSPILSRRMPCSITTPTASLSITEPATDYGIGGSTLDMNQTVYLLRDTNPNPNPTSRTRPLERSMSLEQRSMFLQQLTHSSVTAPATLLSLPLADLDGIRSDAERLGFHVRVLASNIKDDNNYKWVVLGTEDEAVDLLTETFLEEEKKRGSRIENKGRRLTAVAGGVVFGAIAAWTGLAFS